MVLPELLNGYGVTLRRWRPSDAERLHQAVSESVEHLRPWMEWVSHEPLTVGQRRALIESWQEAGRGGNYAIVVEGGVVAGGCGLHDRCGPEALEIGYWTHPRFLRRGIATAAARLLTDTAFTVPGIRWVEIHHDRANERSRGVPRTLGYEFVGEAPDEPTAPAEVGVDCTWRVAKDTWHHSD